MNLNKKTKFVIAVAAQIAIIFAIIIFKYAVLTGGAEVVLQIEPVDPRDPLRGDYVIFRYSDITSVSSHLFAYPEPKIGDDVYVVLRQSNKFFRATSVSKNKPADDRLFIKGTVKRVSTKSEITYGMEEYFIPEGSGTNITSLLQDGNAYAKISVDSDGNAVLKKIYINDKPWP